VFAIFPTLRFTVAYHYRKIPSCLIWSLKPWWTSLKRKLPDGLADILVGIWASKPRVLRRMPLIWHDYKKKHKKKTNQPFVYVYSELTPWISFFYYYFNKTQIESKWFIPFMPWTDLDSVYDLEAILKSFEIFLFFYFILK
jgi:hypothetical protein